MPKKILSFMMAGLLLLSVTGCVLLVAGAVGGVGTAVWLGGKLTQVVNAPMDRTVEATKAALNSYKLELTREVTRVEVVQLRSRYFDGRDMWIDVFKASETTSRIEIRVGTTGDKAGSEKILKRIMSYL